MNRGNLKKIKFIVILVVIVVLAWTIVIKPMITFHQNEKTLESSAKRYFELYSHELPTGTRVRTVSLQKLYDAGLIKGDIFIPLSKKTCSNTNSWVKVRKENGEYKYYVYLECGRYKSSVDHKGPVIKLNGKEEISLGRNEKYKEQGVNSVKDAVDGSLDTKDVIIKSNVDTSKAGTYKVEYIAFDSFSNKTVVTRKVNVVVKLDSEVKNALGDQTNYKGDPLNNYVMFSHMLFRIYGIDSDNNIILVSNSDIANVNYSKIDEWLEYFYDNLSDESKKLIVEKKYCNMKLAENEVSTTKKCTSYTDKKKVYIPSVIEVMNGSDEIGYNYMKRFTMSWVSNTKNDKEAYLTRSVFYGDYYDKDFMAYDINDNYGVRPMLTIKGNLLIKSGEGSVSDPYLIGDTKPVKGGTAVNKCECGEYVAVDKTVFRIIKPEADGTVKVVSDGVLSDEILLEGNPNSEKITYDPKNKNSVAYGIINKADNYLDTSMFTKHEVEVPIYKNKIVYGEEIETKKYNLILAAPNMYEMFSAQTTNASGQGSYWLINTSQAERTGAAIQDVGIPMNDRITKYDRYGLRVTGYLKKGTVVVSGNGSYFKPYKLK